MDTKLFVRKQSGGMFAVIDKGLTTGNIWWVHSGTGTNGAGYGKNPDAPFASMDYANGQITANNGDRGYVMPGHVETVSAAGGLDLDTAGVTWEFLGEGNARGSITFGTDVGADMDIDAADITIINPRFVAAIDALTGPIDVNAARFKLINATWQDGTSINTTDVLVADANADDMMIDGFEFIDGDAGGTQKQSFIQVAGATRPVIKRVRCTGNYGTGNIENGTAWVDALLEDIVLDNANVGPVVGILLQAASSGQARDVHIRVASGTTYVTANNDMQWFESFGTGTDATAGEKIGTLLAGDIEAKIDIVGSDLIVSQSDVKTVLSNLTVAKSDIVAVQSNLTVLDAASDSDMVVIKSDVVAVQSNLSVLDSAVDSDMVVTKSDIAAVKSDLVVLQAAEDSDMVVLKSDVVTVQSNLTVEKSDVVALQSNLTVLDASVDSDMVVTKSDIAAVKSDLVVLQASEDSDMVILKSDVASLMSDLTLFRTKYASDNP